MSLRAISAANLFTVSRPNGSGGYFDKNGVLQQGGPDELVMDHKYDVASGLWVPRGQPVFPSRTNDALNSEDYAASTWTRSKVSITPGQPSPKGDIASIIQNTDSQPGLWVNGGFAKSVGSRWCYSVFIKAGNQNFVSIELAEPGNIRTWPEFDLSDGSFVRTVVYTHADSSYGIFPVGNGWYRAFVSATLETTNPNIYIRPGVWGAQAGDSVQAFGSQFEPGSYPGPYIPTNGSAVTRAADVIDVTSSARWISGEQGTFVANVEIPVLDGNARGVLAMIRSGGQWFEMAVNAAGNSNFNVRATDVKPPISNNGATVVGFETDGEKIAGTWEMGRRAVARSGTSAVENLGGGNQSPLLMDGRAFRIGRGRDGGAGTIGGWVRRIRFSPRVLSNAQLEALVA